MDTVPTPEYPRDYPFEPTDPGKRDRRVAEALADVEAENGVRNEIVGAWLLKMSEEGDSPPPCGP